MKLAITLTMALLFAASATRSYAQLVPYDSVALDSIYLANNIDDPGFMTGKPDGNCAHFRGNGELGAGRFIMGGHPVVMQKGQPLHLYWQIPASQNTSSDSNKAFIMLQRLSDDFRLNGSTQIAVTEPRPFTGTEQMATITVPDTGFNAIAIGVATDSGANSFYLDAIVLVQSGSAGVASGADVSSTFTAYPNPYYHAKPLALHISSEREGNAEVVIADLLGREVARRSIGTISGARDLTFQLDRAGVFVARLYIDGMAVGTPLKIVSE